jgi:hypothetical protein
MPGSIRKCPERCKNVYEMRVFLVPDDYGVVRHKTRRLPRASLLACARTLVVSACVGLRRKEPADEGVESGLERPMEVRL